MRSEALPKVTPFLPSVTQSSSQIAIHKTPNKEPSQVSFVFSEVSLQRGLRGVVIVLGTAFLSLSNLERFVLSGWQLFSVLGKATLKTLKEISTGRSIGNNIASVT